MEPNCAICHGPAYRQCPCEHESLILAVKQSEQRVLHPMWDEIRYWVTTQAKAEIHRDFQARSSYRRAQHSNYLSQNTGRFTNEMLDRVNRELQHGIDDDWRAAVQRYPEVLDYFYSIVAWTVSMPAQPGPMLSPRPDMGNADGYFHGSAGLRHGPFTPPIGGGGPLDGKPVPSRPFYGRNNSYGGSSYSESSGYGSGTGSPTSTGSRTLPFQSYSYARPPSFRP